MRPGSEATPTVDKTDEDWHKMLATHLDATFYCTREALKVMIAKQSGRIINLGSIVGLTGIELAADYGAAKGGNNFVHQVCWQRGRSATASWSICVSPGFIEMLMTAPLTPELRQLVMARTPIGRFGEPRDIAAAALYLACEDSSFMVGQVLSPNGGYVI